MVGFIWAIVRMPSRRSRADRTPLHNARRSTTGDPLVRTAGDRAAVGDPPALFEPVSEPTLVRGRPETKPRSCGKQSVHESLFNGVFGSCLRLCAPLSRPLPLQRK